MAAPEAWWGECRLDVGEMGRWRIGPLELTLARLPTEWRIAWRAGNDPLTTAPATVELPLPVREPEAGMTVARFSFRKSPDQLRLLPALADRSVVVRGVTPFFVPPDETASLFVSTPLWIQVYAPRTAAPLIDIPTHRPSDTWFGANAREGELCYASATLARPVLDDLPVRPHRAVTPVLIKNQDVKALGLERINLPVKALPLLAADGGHLWTRGVILERHKDGVMGAIRFTGTGVPAAARHVAAARAAPAGTIIMQAWSRLFG